MNIKLNLAICLLVGVFVATIDTSAGEVFEVADEADFNKRVLENNKVVVVLFHGIWSVPSIEFIPRLESFVRSYEDVDLAKIDDGKLEDLAREYRVAVLPTVLVFKDGKDINQFSGGKIIENLKPFLNKILGL